MKVDQIQFSTTRAASVLEVPPGTLRSWLHRACWLNVEQAKPGEWRSLGEDDLFAMAVMQKILDFGINIESASAIASLGRLRDNKLRLFIFTGSNGTQCLWTPDETAISLPMVRGADTILVINLHPIKNRLIQRLAP